MFRFYAQEVLTGRLLGEVVAKSFTIHEEINDFGEWSGSFRVFPYDAVSVFDLTELWKIRLIAVRGEIPVYALDIWARERDLGGHEVHLAGRLAGSWLAMVTIGGRSNNDLAFDQVEQQTIARELCKFARSEWGEAGLEFDGPSFGPLRKRDKNTWNASDNKSYGDALSDLSNLQNGFQFRFEPYDAGDGDYRVRLLTGAPFAVERDPIIVEYTDDGFGGYSGNLRGLNLQEAVEVYATDTIVWGKGEGEERLRGSARNQSLAGAIPSLARTENRSDIETTSWLVERAQTILSHSELPAYPPRIQIDPDDPLHPLGSYTVGDRVVVYVDECPEFPHGLLGTWRIYEIEYDPSDESDLVTLTIGDQSF